MKGVCRQADTPYKIQAVGIRKIFAKSTAC